MRLTSHCRARVGVCCGILALVTVGLLPTQAFGQVDNSMSTVGTNFWFMYDNQYTWPFVDFFKQSREFWSGSSSQWDDGRALTLDTNGYPTSLLSGQHAATLLFWAGTAHYPVGQYVLLYDGQGTVSVDFSQGAAINVVSSAPGRIVVNVPAGNEGFRIRIMATTSGNHVRNIRFIAPGFEQTYATQIFHPLFLERLKEMRCLRFMDWMKANSTTITEWSQRTKPTSQTQGEGSASGVALEYLVELCNRLNCDGWFCLPVRGSNACFRQYATYIRDHLNPCLKAYFEYGNECWNGGVQSNAGWLDQLGQSLGFSAGWSAQHHGWARRMTDMLAVVDSVYQGLPNRRVRVIATQVGNTGVVDGLLHYYGGENYGDAIAVAPYFNPGGARGSTNLNLILDSLASQAARVDNVISGDLAIANAHNMKIVGYESGLDVWPASFGFSESLAVQIRFNSRMESIYTTYLNNWRSGGGTLINQYTFCNPSWGVMRYMDQDTSQAPAYLAMMHFARSNPRWWTETRDTCSSVAVAPQPATSRTQPARLAIDRSGRLVRVSAAGSGAVVRVYGIDGRRVTLTALPASGSVLLAPAGGGASGCYVVTAGAEGAAPVTLRTAAVR